MSTADILKAIEPVARAFDKLGVPYYIGGSVASSAYGMARSTMDVDIAAGLQTHHVQPFVKLLEAAYYIDENTILDAVRGASSFNLIHLETMLKIDVFIAKKTPHAVEAFKRKRLDTLDEEQESARFYLASPEDIILHKLAWYRLGQGISDCQWKDILGVLKVQGHSIDRQYLLRWAPELRLVDLLEKAFNDAGLPLHQDE